VLPADEAASAAVARAASALAAAETTHTAAQAGYESARLDLAATLADHDAALARVTELHTLADTAVTRADASSRALAALVRAMVQQGSDTAALDALLGAQGQDDLLSRLGTVDRLTSLTGNITEIREQVEVDSQRSNALQADVAAAEATVAAIPLDEKQATLAAAELALSQATAALTAASENAALAQAESADASAARTAEAASSLAGLLGARLSGQGWATPAVGIINDGFGPRPNLPLPGVEPFHSGTDLASACGAPIYAASAGVVSQTGRLGTYGNWILIDHGEGVNTGYAHIADGATLVDTGDTVTAGQVIAGVGSTGASTGCHLHIEVRIDGTAVDPQPFFAEHGIDLGAG
jgi:murein DD-endopeptidase MepM/ murein hydrolase activator NlpD